MKLASDALKPLGAAFWRMLGNSSVRMIKEITRSGRDVDNRAFDAYSPKYAERKGAGKFGRQNSKSASPDLTLTGDMLRDLRTLETTRDHAAIGWSAHGDRAQWNAEAGRAIMNFDEQGWDVLHDRVGDSAFLLIAQERGRLIDDWAKEPVVIPVKP